MNFGSDNWAGAHPKILEALTAANAHTSRAYGHAPDDAALDETISRLFECDTRVFLVTTGTAANSLAVSAMTKPGDVVFCHEMAHIRVDECGAPGFFTPGLQLHGVAGSLGRMDIQCLDSAINHVREGGLNAGRPGGLSLTQATESGTLYSPGDIATLSKAASGPVHMDGARFSNAIAATGATPGDMTWRQGVDLLSFGATKNGCLCAEALLVFNPTLAQDLNYLRKRSGHLISKMRFMTAQLTAYLHDDLWLHCATQANSQADKLARAISQSKRIRLAWQPQINEVFAICDVADFKTWSAQGLRASVWQAATTEAHLIGENEVLIRMVTSFATTDSELEQFKALL